MENQNVSVENALFLVTAVRNMTKLTGKLTIMRENVRRKT